MFVLSKDVLVGVVCLLVVLQAQVSQSQGARKCVKKMNPGDSKTVKIPCNGQTKGCKPFCKKECDGYIFMCEGGHLEADMQNVNLDCDLEKIVVNDGSGPVSMCDPMDDITAGEKLTIRYKKLGDASFFDDGSCTSTKPCRCSYTVTCVGDTTTTDAPTTPTTPTTPTPTPSTTTDTCP